MIRYVQLILILGIFVILPNLYKCYHILNNDVNRKSNEIFKNNFHSNDDATIWSRSWSYIKTNMKICLLKGHHQHHIQNHDHNLQNHHNFTINQSNTNWEDAKEIPIYLLFTNRWLNCFNMTSLKLFDFITTLKVITLMNGIQLVQIEGKNDLPTLENHHELKPLEEDAKNKLDEETTSKFQTSYFRKLVDPAIDNFKTNLMNTITASKKATITSNNKINEINFKNNIKQRNMRALDIDQLYESEESLLPSSSTSIPSIESSLFLSLSWILDILKKLNNMLTTHVLQINFDKFDNNHNNIVDDNHTNNGNNELNNKNTDKVTGRHRHRRNNMMMAMMFGVTAMGAIVIPVGFQFLSVVAGKALLLSKMALMLASISSLRKIATSGLHYGLYHLPEAYGGLGGYYDRGDSQIHPRFPRNIR